MHSVPPMRLPVRLQVTGCPLSLRPECAGLDLTSRETDPTLRFGQCAVGTERPPVKHVRVKNSGPVDARLTWRLVREGAAKERRLAAVGLTPTGDEDRPVHVTVSYEEPAAYEPPFIITPSVLTVPARRRTVSLGERRSPFGLSSCSVLDGSLVRSRRDRRPRSCALEASAREFDPVSLGSRRERASVAGTGALGRQVRHRVAQVDRRGRVGAPLGSRRRRDPVLGGRGRGVGLAADDF